jgi:hypothetical protein
MPITRQRTKKRGKAFFTKRLFLKGETGENITRSFPKKRSLGEKIPAGKTAVFLKALSSKPGKCDADPYRPAGPEGPYIPKFPGLRVSPLKSAAF